MKSQPAVTICVTLFVCFASITQSSHSAPLYRLSLSDEALQTGAFSFSPIPGYALALGEAGRFAVGGGFQEGYRLSLSPGEGAFLTGGEPIEVDAPIALVLDYAILGGDPNLAVVGMNTNGADPDGQFGFTQRIRHSEANPIAARRLITIFQPPSGALFPAAQVVNSTERHDNAEVVLLSLSVYAYDDEAGVRLSTEPEGVFETAPVNLRTNINLDEGSVEYDPESRSVRLLAGLDQAANFALAVEDFDFSSEETLLIAEVDAYDETDGDSANGRLSERSFALIFFSEDWASGLFTHQPNTLGNTLAGGNYIPDGKPLDIITQSAGGAEDPTPFPVWVGGLTVKTVAFTAARDLPEAASGDIEPKDVAAALFLPKKLFAGGQSSYSLMTVKTQDQQPISLPYQVLLTRGEEERVLGWGVTDAKGTASRRFDLPNLATGAWNVSVRSANFILASGAATVEDGRALFIETDKPVYRPSQIIQGRVLSLNNALAPLPGEVELVISDAKGIRIHRETVTTDDYGVAPFELPLADELNFGVWKITAQAGAGARVEKDIEVDRYVLPAFDVQVRLTKDWFLAGKDRVSGVIESRYFFGQPVQGTARVEALRYVGVWETYATAEGRLTDGLFAFDLPPVPYGAGTPGAQGDATVQIKVSVTDDTGRAEERDSLASLVDAGARLRMIVDSPMIKPGLEQELLIVAQTPDRDPLSIPVNLTITYTNQEGETLRTVDERLSTEIGLASYRFSAPARTALASFQISARLDDRAMEETLMLSAAYSPGGHFIHLRQETPETAKVGSAAEFRVISTHGGTVFYDVVTRGRTLFSGSSESGRIAFTVTPEMSPKARVIAYQIQPNNEVSADALPFEVELASSVGLEAIFDAEEARPGQEIGLTIQSQGQAMVGLAIVDESVFALAEGRLNLRNIFDELERLFMEPQIEIHQDPHFPMPEPFPYLGSKGTQEVLAEHNLQAIVSDSLIVPKGEEMDPWRLFGRPWFRGDFLVPMPEEAVDASPPSGGDFQEPDRVRSFFPETWVWNPQLLTGADGSARLELTAPDSITTWKLHALSTSPLGMGVAESHLRVFQDFFVEPDLPYAVIRGDRFPLRARIFNYLDEEQLIRVSLSDNDALGLQDDAVQEIVVPAASLASVSFTLEPNKVGAIPIELIAQSARRADAVRRDLRVEPEGARREIIHNGILRGATEVEIDFSIPHLFDEDEPLLRDSEPFPPLLPIPIVPDSERWRVAVTGSLLGQSMSGLDDLLGMPFGCGEQNMILLAPNIEVLRYLRATGQLNPPVEAKARFFITTGYQRQLTYQRSDGSFSAFGEQDESGSLWLTAFVAGVFSRARATHTIDPQVLMDAVSWVLDRQRADGAWEPVGFVIHQEMIGGLEGELTLTAFVLNALMDYGEASPTVLERGFGFLESRLTDAADDAYALAQIAYALARANRPSAGQAVDLLLRLARTASDGMMWAPNSIETTAYAAMALTLQNRDESQAALEWLATQRNSLGGYGGTQDTVVALMALTQAAILQSRELDASVEVWVDGELSHTFRVNSNNFDVLQTLEIESAQTITLRQRGEGTVVYQALYAFNVPVVGETQPISELDLRVEYSADHIEVDDLVDVSVYLEYRGRLEKTGMTIVDVSVPTGFAVERPSLDRVREHPQIKRIEVAGRKAIFYIDHLLADEPLVFEFQARALYPVRADGGVSQAYLYYEPNNRSESAGGILVIE